MREFPTYWCLFLLDSWFVSLLPRKEGALLRKTYVAQSTDLEGDHWISTCSQVQEEAWLKLTLFQSVCTKQFAPGLWKCKHVLFLSFWLFVDSWKFVYSCHSNNTVACVLSLFCQKFSHYCCESRSQLWCTLSIIDSVVLVFCLVICCYDHNTSLEVNLDFV
jgi:hypothetical protein